MDVLTSEMVVLGAHAADKLEATRQAGEVLVKAGCVAPAYVDLAAYRSGLIQES